MLNNVQNTPRTFKCITNTKTRLLNYKLCVTLHIALITTANKYVLKLDDLGKYHKDVSK